MARGAETVRVRLTDCAWAGLPESATANVSVAPVEAAVGVPVMAPVDAFSASPAGKVPLVRDQA